MSIILKDSSFIQNKRKIYAEDSYLRIKRDSDGFNNTYIVFL